MKTTPLFSLLFAYWLILWIVDSLPIVGAIIGLCFLPLVAFFAPFISRKQWGAILGLWLARLTYYWFAMFAGWGLTLVFAGYLGVLYGACFAYVSAYYFLKKRKIRQRVGKGFH